MADDDEKKEEGGGGAPAWMCTFADLMSLLMCFFVLLLSFSVMDNQKFKQVAGSVEKAFGMQTETRVWDSPQGQNIISQEFQTVPLDVQATIQQELESELEEGVIEAEHQERGLILRIKDTVAFASGKTEMQPKFRRILDKLGAIIKSEDLIVEISGHTDNVAIAKGAPYSSNYDLSAARAVTVADYWTKRLKLPSAKMIALGFADGHPVASNATEAGRARNRRVEFFLRPKNAKMAFSGLQEVTGQPQLGK